MGCLSHCYYSEEQEKGFSSKGIPMFNARLESGKVVKATAFYHNSQDHAKMAVDCFDDSVYLGRGCPTMLPIVDGKDGE